MQNGIINGSPQNCNWKSHPWGGHITWDPFPTGTQIAINKGLCKCCSSLDIRSVHFSRSVVSNSLQPHESQHTRPPCPSPTPGVYLNLCPLSWWCHPAISSSVVLFSSCPQSLPALWSQLFASGGQTIGVSASELVLSMNTQDRSTLGWTDWTSLPSKGLSRVFSNTTVQKHQFFGVQLSL